MANWINEPETGATGSGFYLLIDDTYFFLIDDTFKLIIEQLSAVQWTNENES